MTQEDAAKDYLAKGFSVIPVKGKHGSDVDDAKRPLIAWEEFQKRRASTEEISQWFKEWPKADLAVITGPISDLFIIDLDGTEWRQSTAGKEFPMTPIAKTTRGGFHYWCRWTPQLAEYVTNKARILPGVDIRGMGGYAVVPPSHGFNGTPYSWSDGLSLEDCQRSEPPAWIFQYLARKNGNGHDAGNVIEKTPIPAILSGVPSGQRNQEMARLAGYHHSLGMTPDTNLAYLRLANGNCNPPLPDSELRAIVKSICRYPAGNRQNNSFHVSVPYRGEKREMNSCRMESVALADFLVGGEAEIAWCIDGILPVEGTGILGGTSGYGKSWLLADLAIECARGGRWLGQFQTKACRVLYIDEESTDRLIRKRLKKLLAGKGLEGRLPDLHFCIAQGLCFTSPESVLALRAKLEELKPSLVIVDTLIRVYQGDENSASEMAAVFSVVKSIVRDFKCSILFADHQRKLGNFSATGDQLLRGSSEKTAFVDTLLSLQKKDENLYVEHSKSRFAEAVPSFAISIEDDPGKTVTTVKYLGEAAPLKEAARLGPAIEFVAAAVTDDWISRQKVIEQAKDRGITEKLVDEALKALHRQGMLEMDKRKPEEGPGGKRALYRKKNDLNPSNNSFLFPAPIYTEKRETNSEAPSSHPNISAALEVFGGKVRL